MLMRLKFIMLIWFSDACYGLSMSITYKDEEENNLSIKFVLKISFHDYERDTMTVNRKTALSFSGVARNLFWGAFMRPERPKFKAEGRERGEVLGEGQQAPSPPARGSGKALKATASRFGGEDRAQMHLDAL